MAFFVDNDAATTKDNDETAFYSEKEKDGHAKYIVTINTAEAYIKSKISSDSTCSKYADTSDSSPDK